MSDLNKLLEERDAEITSLKAIIAEAEHPNVCEENAHLRGKLDECERRYTHLGKVLKDEPMVVAQSMRRGSVAKPSLSDIVSVYKDDAPALARLLVKTYPEQFDKSVVRKLTQPASKPNLWGKLVEFADKNTALAFTILAVTLFVIVYIVEPIILK